MRINKNLFILCGTLLIILSPGCSKKMTKVEPTLPQSSKTAESQPPQPYKPSDNDSFREQDIDANLKAALVTVYFDFDKSFLLPSEIPKLQRVAKLLSENKNIRVLCEGHCDDRGSNDYNMGLGENRAFSVKKWLTAYGISEYRIETTSYGKERPAVPNCSDESCYAQNRRVEWKVIAK